MLQMQSLMDALVRMCPFYGNTHKMAAFPWARTHQEGYSCKRTLGFSGKEAQTLWGEMDVGRQQEAQK